MLPAASVFVVFWCHLSSLLHRNQLLLSESYMRFSKTYMPLQQAIVSSFLKDSLPGACNSSAVLWILHSYLQGTVMPRTVNISASFVPVGLSSFLPDAFLNYPLPTHIRLISVSVSDCQNVLCLRFQLLIPILFLFLLPLSGAIFSTYGISFTSSSISSTTSSIRLLYLS